MPGLAILRRADPTAKPAGSADPERRVPCRDSAAKRIEELGASESETLGAREFTVQCGVFKKVESKAQAALLICEGDAAASPSSGSASSPSSSRFSLNRNMAHDTTPAFRRRQGRCQRERPDTPRLLLTGRCHGLAQPEGSGLLHLQHAGGGHLRQSATQGDSEIRPDREDECCWASRGLLTLIKIFRLIDVLRRDYLLQCQSAMRHPHAYPGTHDIQNG